MKLDAVIEISKGSNIKYEIENGKLLVDRILFGANYYPENYGFIENTLDWDGDPLDIMVIADQGFLPTAIVPTRVLGAMKMIDGGETDTKLIGVIDCDVKYKDIKDMKDLPQNTLDQIQDFFENYKNLQKKKVVIKGFEGVEYAKKELAECQELYKNYKDLPKDEFIKKMMKDHPEKYEV